MASVLLRLKHGQIGRRGGLATLHCAIQLDDPGIGQVRIFNAEDIDAILRNAEDIDCPNARVAREKSRHCRREGQAESKEPGEMLWSKRC